MRFAGSSGSRAAEPALAAGGLQIEALPGTGDYLALVMQFILAFGISFLLPVLLMLLNRAGIVSRESLKKARRYVIVAIVALAAIITPPDPGSQLVLAVPLYLLFEGSLFLMWLTDRRKKSEPEEDEAVEEDNRESITGEGTGA